MFNIFNKAIMIVESMKVPLKQWHNEKLQLS